MKIIKAGYIFQRYDKKPIKNGLMVVENEKILDVLPYSQETEKTYLERNHKSEFYDFSRFYIIPGLINCHCHLSFPGDGTENQKFVEQNDDNFLSVMAYNNAKKALMSGVTTLRDLGSRNETVFSVKKSIENNIVEGPRIILSGPALVMTGGHMYYLNGEADGVEEIRKKVRLLIKKGADLIKIIANGGGTKNTIPWKMSYSKEEIFAAVEETHRLGKYATAHVSNPCSIKTCLDAGIDGIEHCDFWINRNEYVYDPNLVKRIVDQGVYIGKTLPAVYRTLQYKNEIVDTMSQEEIAEYYFQKRILKNSTMTFKKMYDNGVKLVASTDSGWGLNPFDDFVTDLELMVDNGMIESDALQAATTNAAKALFLDTEIGSLEKNKYADYLVIEKNPLENVSELRNIKKVFKGGTEVT